VSPIRSATPHSARRFRDAVAACAVIGASFGAVGCTAKPPASQLPDAETAIAQLRSQQQCAHGVQGTAKVDVVTQRGRVKGDVYLFAVAPDRVRFDVVSPFGATIYTLTSDGADFKLADQEQKAFFTGPASACNLARFTQVPVPPHALGSMLRGQAPVLRHRPTDVTIAWDGAGYYRVDVASEHEATEELRLAVDPNDWSKPWREQRLRLVGVRVAQAGRSLYEADLDGHFRVETAPPRVDEDGLDDPVPPSGPPCEAELPRRVQFRISETSDDVLFEYAEAKWNPPLLAETFTQPVPGGMRVVPVRCD
jgi:hypothetical protein